VPTWAWLFCWWWGPGELAGLLLRKLSGADFILEHREGEYLLRAYSLLGHWPRGILRAFGMGMICIGGTLLCTTPEWVLPHPTDMDPFRADRALTHEMVHRQQQVVWGLAFWPAYLLSYLVLLAVHQGHLRAYLAIPFEVSARASEALVGDRPVEPPDDLLPPA
jgi:hypothetical protein